MVALGPIQFLFILSFEGSGFKGLGVISWAKGSKTSSPKPLNPLTTGVCGFKVASGRGVQGSQEFRASHDASI